MDFYKEDGVTLIPREQLPTLVILTGLNGSGKTRGLKQMQASDPYGTQYIDYSNFSAHWDGSTYESSSSHGEIVLNDMISDWKNPPKSDWIMGFHPLMGVSDNQDLVTWMQKNRTSMNFAKLGWKFFEIFPEARNLAFDIHASLLSKYPEKAEIYWDQFGRDPVSVAYKDACKRTKLPAHCVSNEAVVQSLDRLQRLKHPLHFNLSSLLAKYAEKRNKFLYESWIQKLDSQCLEDFNRSNPDPVNHINVILKQLADDEAGVFQFEIQTNLPEPPPTYEQLKELPRPVPIKLRDINSGESREFGELSSGEKTLLALASLIYTHKYIQPMRTLYLDEIDASLHPTMIMAMINILKEQASDTSFYLATHSPSTVALAPEDALFYVEKGRARKIVRSEALEGLTQGYFITEGIATVFRTLNGVDKDIIVISEGKNVDYLGPILNKLGYDNRIHVHRWANPGAKGTNNLEPLMSIFAEMITSSPRRFVFLFDCDADPKKFTKSTNHVIGIFLKQIKDDHPVTRGIENIIPRTTLEKTFGPEIYKNIDSGVVIKNSFKDEVCKHFISELEAGHIDLRLMRNALNELLDLADSRSTRMGF